jgi:RND family efflux transporter MFP subunit
MTAGARAGSRPPVDGKETAMSAAFRHAVALAAALAAAPSLAQTRPATGPDFDCLVDAHSRARVSASVTGLIERMHVDRGDRVRAGQVLVELESSVERAQLEVARARAANTQPIEAARTKVEVTAKAAERLIRLRQANPGALTAAQYEEAIAQARIAEFNLRDAELTQEGFRLEALRAEAILRQRSVVSPLDGVVTERLMSAGEHRHEQAHFLTVARIDPLHVEVYVPIALFGKVRAGDTADVTLEAPLGSRHRATVLVVDQVLDTASGTFGIRLALPNPDLAIPAGLRCKVRFGG